MEQDRWWYSVTDVATGATVEDSTVSGCDVKDGVAARRKCEEVARRFLELIP
jgi:hypothetical protein